MCSPDLPNTLMETGSTTQNIVRSGCHGAPLPKWHGHKIGWSWNAERKQHKPLQVNGGIRNYFQQTVMHCNCTKPKKHCRISEVLKIGAKYACLHPWYYITCTWLGLPKRYPQLVQTQSQTIVPSNGKYCSGQDLTQCNAALLWVVS